MQNSQSLAHVPRIESTRRCDVGESDEKRALMETRSSQYKETDGAKPPIKVASGKVEATHVPVRLWTGHGHRLTGE